MAQQPPATDSFVEPDLTDEVSFSIVCKPVPGMTLTEFKSKLSRKNIRELKPPEHVRDGVAAALEARGFEVFDIPGPVVFARGTVAEFQRIFRTKLARLVRSPKSERGKKITAIVVAPDAPPPSVEDIPGALLVSLMEPPQLAEPRVAPADAQFCMRLPGDVAQLTAAAATHRKKTPSGDVATGKGVAVAVIDTGFARHPYFRDHGYDITRLAAPDTSHPEVDDDAHGTYVVATLLACAPDARVYAIKYGRLDLAFGVALDSPDVQVISLSWTYTLPATGDLPDWMLGFIVLVLDAVDMGVNVVVATGNFSSESYPATLPDVIAVGGVAVDPTDGLSVWGGTTSFRSTQYRGRAVPDICGIASKGMLPMPRSPSGSKYGWEFNDLATSGATPQVAGVVALLLQKNPALTPDDIKKILIDTGRDVAVGASATGDHAHSGPDAATGGGLVNALKAWNRA